MLIFEEQRAIFIHIWKTGGTSIRRTLAPYGWRPKWRNHPIYADLPDKYRSYFTWTVVRNPWDWLVSMYHAQFQHGNGEKDKAFRERWPTWKSYVCGLFEKNRPDEMMNQVEFLAVDGIEIENIDYIGFFEALPQSYAVGCRLSKLPSPRLPSMNHSQHKHYSHYYEDPRVKREAEAWLLPDLEVFGYEFEEEPVRKQVMITPSTENVFEALRVAKDGLHSCHIYAHAAIEKANQIMEGQV